MVTAASSPSKVLLSEQVFGDIGCNRYSQLRTDGEIHFFVKVQRETWRCRGGSYEDLSS